MKQGVIVGNGVFPIETLEQAGIHYTKQEPESPAEEIYDYKELYDKMEFENPENDAHRSERNAKRAQQREIDSRGIKQKYMGKKSPFNKIKNK